MPALQHEGTAQRLCIRHDSGVFPGVSAEPNFKVIGRRNRPKAKEIILKPRTFKLSLNVRDFLSNFDHLHHAVPAKNIDLFCGADRLPAFRTSQLAGAAGAFAARCDVGSRLGCSPSSSRADERRQAAASDFDLVPVF